MAEITVESSVSKHLDREKSGLKALIGLEGGSQELAALWRYVIPSQIKPILIVFVYKAV